MDIDWSSVLPVWLSQSCWNVIIILVVTTVTRHMLRQEGDRLARTLLPLLKRVEAMGFVTAEQTTMTVAELQKVVTKQSEQTIQVEHVPELTADKVIEKVADHLPQPETPQARIIPPVTG